jgi:nitric oxide reductase NorD protein
LQGGLSARMGATLRHAGWHLTQQSATKRLVLLITDGEPANIDGRDPQYLRNDAKPPNGSCLHRGLPQHCGLQAVDLRMQGMHTYCLPLDPQVDRYVACIFGENNYAVVDHVEKLPERFPMVFAALTA